MITAKQFNQLSPAQQLDALHAKQRKARTSQATYERQVALIEASQKRKAALLADVLTYCPEFLNGEPLNAAV